MRRRLEVIALLAGVGLGRATSAAGATSSEEVRVRLLEHLAAGRADSALSVVRAERTWIPDILDWCVVERARCTLRGQPDSAAAHLASARDIARLHALSSGDSLYLRLVDFQEALTGRALASDAGGWSLYGQCKQLDRTWQFPPLQKLVPDLIRIAMQVPDPYLETRARRIEGRLLWMTASDVPRARAAMNVALERARSLRDRHSEFQIRLMISMMYDGEDRLDEAMKILMELLEPLRREDDWGLYLPALKGIASIHLRRGDLEAALHWYREGLEEARRVGSKRYESLYLWQMGYTLSLLGEAEEAIRSEKEAVRLARETGDTGPELGAMISLAEILNGQEYYTRALATLDEALPIAEKSGMKEAIALIYAQIGEAYRELGRTDEAVRLYDRVLPSARSVGGVRLETSLLRDLARAHLDLRQPDQAGHYLDEAIRALAGTQLSLHLAVCCLDLGALYRMQGKAELADAYLRRARTLADSVGNPVLLGEVERTQAQLAASRGEAEQALALFDSAIRHGGPTGATGLLRQALVAKAEFLRARGELRGADSLLANAIDLVESVRGRQAGEDLRIGFLLDKKSIYAARVAVLYDLGHGSGAAPETREAFHVAERARARELLDVVSGIHAEPDREVDAAARDKVRRLAARVSALQTELSQAVAADSWKSSEVDSLEREHEKVAREYHSALDEVAVRDPSYAALSGQRPALDLDAVRSRVLDADRALLEYLVADSETYLFLVTKDRFRVVRIPVGSDTLAAWIADFRSAGLRDTAGGEASALPPQAQHLYSVLLGSVADDLGPGQRLLIVPDGPLFHLPFGALHDGEAFLIQKHAIAYGPSASLLDPALARRRRRAPRSLLAVGNPKTFRAEELLAGLREGDQWRFGELPYSEEEVRQAARCFGSAVTLTGDRATEEAVKAAIGNASHVHFATHALLKEEEPLLSGLVLAQDEDPAEDGVLQTHEILRLGLAADLVVLSACNTGLGRIAGGEGVLGLTRAFLHAGARSILISLWEVEDRATVDLMSAFYRHHIEQRLPVDVALQRAQIAALSSGASVREWAPFILMGSVARPQGAFSLGPLGIAVLLVLVLVLAGVWAVRSARPRRSVEAT